MPVELNGNTFYRTKEACEEAGISRSTFFRWLKDGTFADVRYRDRRGWRLFAKEDVDRLKALAGEVRVQPGQVELGLR